MVVAWSLTHIVISGWAPQWFIFRKVTAPEIQVGKPSAQTERFPWHYWCKHPTFKQGWHGTMPVPNSPSRWAPEPIAPRCPATLKAPCRAVFCWQNYKIIIARCFVFTWVNLPLLFFIAALISEEALQLLSGGLFFSRSLRCSSSYLWGCFCLPDRRTKKNTSMI